MFKPVTLFIGLRYALKKPSQFFISFVSMSALIGIALGVAILITVMSVMNGFNNEIRSRIINNSQQVVITKQAGSDNTFEQINPMLKANHRITHIHRFISMQGLLAVDQRMIPTLLRGTDFNVKNDVTLEPIVKALKTDKFAVVLTTQMADQYNLHIGDKITIMVPVWQHTGLTHLPRMKQFHIAGFVKRDHSYYAYISIPSARKLGALNSSFYTGLELQIKNPSSAHFFAKTLQDRLPQGWLVSDWSEQYQHFFDMIAMQKSMMFLVLFLIIVIATFGLISGQVMMVVEKKREIAILKSLGLSQFNVLIIFIIQGIIIGLFGILLGFCLGWWLSLNVTQLVFYIEKLIGHRWLSHALYMMDHLPSQLNWHDVYVIMLSASVLCLLATIYPAIQAAKLKPIEIFKSGQGV